MSQHDVWGMVHTRAAAAGITARIGCHTFRATGITAHLGNGIALAYAGNGVEMSPRTTKCTKEWLTQDEVKRIRL